MTVKIKDLARYTDALLDASCIKDYCPNGMQVEGSETISHAVCAVTASLAVVEEAARRRAGALLVHHGYFWRGEEPRLIGARGRRIKALMAADINLLAWHLPLDLHPELGNNAQFGRQLGWVVSGVAGDRGLIAYADLDVDLSAAALATLLRARLDREPLLVGALDRPIRRVAWCTGGAQDMLDSAIDLGADAFISGEISERTTHVAREAGVVYAAAGHHATERFGIQALAAHLSGHFGIPIDFIDDPNPV